MSNDSNVMAMKVICNNANDNEMCEWANENGNWSNNVIMTYNNVI